MSDDAQLIEQALGGHSEAFGQLVLKYQDRLFNTVFHVVGHAEDARDIVQEAFVQAFLKLDMFRRHSAFYTWLYRIAFNAAMTSRRKRRPTLSVDRAKENGNVEPLIADPDLPAKLVSGRAAQVRPCVSCNEDCRTFDPVLLCSVNPELAPAGAARRPAAPLLVQESRRWPGEQGRDRRRRPGRAGVRGCPGRRARARGRAPPWLAGERLSCSTSATRSAGSSRSLRRRRTAADGGPCSDFYRASIEAADGVTLRLATTAGPAELAGFSEVVLAVGSEEVLPEIAGIERAVASSLVIASGPPALAGREHLLIVDDGFGSWSCASAVELGVLAAVPRITVATPGAAFGASLPAEGRVQLIARLRGAPLDVLPFTALTSVGDGHAELGNTMSGATRRIAADAVIVVGERRARDWQSLVPPGPRGPTVRVIGDAVVPRRVAHAISEGRAAADAIRASRAPGDAAHGGRGCPPSCADQLGRVPIARQN